MSDTNQNSDEEVVVQNPPVTTNEPLAVVQKGLQRDERTILQEMEKDE